MNIQEKRLFRSDVNAKSVDIKRRSLERFGWTNTKTERDTKRQIDIYYYTRDLDDASMQKLAEKEDLYNQASLAEVFADCNIEYCNNQKRALKKAKKHVFRFVLMVFLILLSLGLAFVFKYTDLITQGGFKMNGETIQITKDFVYDMPEGEEFFGYSHITYDILVNIIFTFMIAIAMICGVIFLILVKNASTKRMIRRAECDYLDTRREYFEEFLKAIGETADKLYIED